jgi:hypothetical protein
MPRRNFLLPLLLFVMVALFTCLLVRLLLLRYERGDVYPAYSTLRADPLGTRAFYEAVGSTGKYKVARGFTSLHRELEGKPNALLYLGLSANELSSFTKDEVAALDTYVSEGGRVIITFEPRSPLPTTPDIFKKTEKKKTGPPGKDPAPTNPAEKPPDDDSNSAEPQTQQEKFERGELRRESDDDDAAEKRKDKIAPDYHRSIAALWGFGYERHSESEEKKKSDENKDGDTPPEVLAVSSIYTGIESTVPWKSALYFVRLEPEWRPLLFAKSKPVLIRREWGQGAILIATDSYFISNEALRNDRHPMLLHLFAGWPGSLLFDEAHLGTQEQEGVMALAEKFRLEGFLYGMLGVVALLLWRNSLPLAPPRATDGRLPLGGAISGKDSRSGLVNLLRRNILPSEILGVCFTEWKRGVTPGRRHLQSQIPQMESIIAGTPNQPGPIVQSYHDLRNINAPGKVKGTYATKP